MPTIEREVTLPTDVEGAWALLTRPEDLTAWLGAEVDLIPAPGAVGTVVDHDGTTRRLVVDEVDAGRRLAWTWWSDDDAGAPSRVEINIAPADGGTSVRVVEELGAVAPTARASVGEAWSHRLLHLEALLLVAAAVRG
jgi:uncharacterized protein YndB with AHSA1/START domain